MIFSPPFPHHLWEKENQSIRRCCQNVLSFQINFAMDKVCGAAGSAVLGHCRQQGVHGKRAFEKCLFSQRKNNIKFPTQFRSWEAITVSLQWHTGRNFLINNNSRKTKKRKKMDNSVSAFVLRKVFCFIYPLLCVIDALGAEVLRKLILLQHMLLCQSMALLRWAFFRARDGIDLWSILLWWISGASSWAYFVPSAWRKACKQSTD